MKTNQIAFWISTLLLTALMLYSVSMYFLSYETTTHYFVQLGYPVYLIYPLAAVKIIGLLIIWFFYKYRSLLEWVYAGFFFNFMLAFFAHFLISDGSHFGAFTAVVLLLISYFTGKKVRSSNG
ncbi:MAG: DoxX family protein [Flavobacteriaceae bacterium]|nr:DoxX family protein [Flavobacteriaceae bacterium]